MTVLSTGKVDFKFGLGILLGLGCDFAKKATTATEQARL